LSALQRLGRRDGPGWSAEQREAWEGETAYFRKNVGRMDYPSYEANG
jgi:hypothetical protein